jgi:uncharacterized protein (TIGR03032 family)
MSGSTIDIDPMSRYQDRDAQSIAVDYEHSGNLAAVLRALNLSVVLSTYQAGKLVVVGSCQGKTSFSFHSFDQVMGLAASSGQIAVGARRQIHFLKAAHEVASSLPPAQTYDGCFVARNSFVTGSIHGHDLAFGNEGLWVVNTLFSCLCTLEEDYNFYPRWRPPFISQLIDQDRCHLNGLALENGAPRFVTVLGVTDQPAGWRSNKKSGGAILDVPSGEIISRGLCMPHSPRVYQGKLWVLNSGCGELATVDLRTGKLDTVASLPGYTRGLSFYGNYAFIGLSRIRETNVFGGLPIGEHPERLHCGLGIVDITSGRTIATLQFKTGVEELFAVETLPGVLNPKFSGPSSAPGDEADVWIVPPLQAQTMMPRPSIGAVAIPSSAEPNSLPISAPPSSPKTKETIVNCIQQADAAQAAGQPQSALDWLKRAVTLDPNSVAALNRLGNLHQDLNDKEHAMACYQRAIVVDPQFAAAHQNLGVLHVANNEPLRALYHFEKAQQSSPHPVNLLLAGKVLPIIYESKEHVEYWRNRLTACVDGLVEQRIKVDTTDSVIPTSFHFAYQGQNDRHLMEQLGKVYQGVDLCQASQGRRSVPASKKIRVGFVSAYFCQHTIGLLNLGLIENLPRDRFEVVVIALRHHQDQYADRFRAAADQYIEVLRSPAQARETIAELRLDILVFADVGMDTLSQTLSYSRMAPIQAVTWGHPDTTGSPAIDYFVSTDLAEPADAQEHYSEKLVRLPTMGVYYHRPSLQGPQRDHSYFGLNPNRHIYLCPQTLFKFHPDFDEPLRRILESDPEGDLVLLQGGTPSWTEPLMKRWRVTLPNMEQRVKILPSFPRVDFLHLLALADVMLDPFPFCGGNTSYEALSFGTPIVTFPGRFLRGRLTHGLYQRIGLESLSATSVDQYVDIALALGRDRDRNIAVRHSIRERADVLFENQADVENWSDTLVSWVEGMR